MKASATLGNQPNDRGMGDLYVISAPSGAGKTSLVKAMVESIARIEVSLSHTTRPIRAGEQDRVHYRFVDTATFNAMIDNSEFLEYAEVFGNYYGTTRATVLARLRQGIDVILEIDWQGARQVRSVFPTCICIYVLPPSRTVLEQRLRARAQDSEEVIAGRMLTAASEMSHYREFDYAVVNDDFHQALRDLTSIVCARRLTIEMQAHKLIVMLKSLLD